MGVKKFIKKSVAFVAAAAMALTMVVVPVGAGTSYADGTGSTTTDPNPNLVLDKSAKLQDDGTYKITLEAYAKGKVDVTPITTGKPCDIVLVLDQSGSMAYDFDGNTIGWWNPNISRQSALKEAAKNFINNVSENAMKDSNNLVDHKIALVTFGNSSSIISGNNTDSSAFVSVKNTAGRDSLLTDITNLPERPEGATAIDKGMSTAKSIMDANQIGDQDRKRIVVVFTDGYPTTHRNFDLGVANSAIKTSKQLKDNNTTIYTIGIFKGAKVDELYGSKTGNVNSSWNASPLENSDGADAAANRFLNYVSSNFKNADSLGLRLSNTTFTITKNFESNGSKYYMTADSKDELNNIFETISDDVISGGTSVNLDKTAVARDIISNNFDLPKGYSKSKVIVKTANYKGHENWDEPEVLNDAKIEINGKTIDVSNFDYKTNYVAEATTKTDARGQKLIIEITDVVANKAGMNLDTNTEESGIYSNNEFIKAFPQPKVDIDSTSYVLDYGKTVTTAASDYGVSAVTIANADEPSPYNPNAAETEDRTNVNLNGTYGKFAISGNDLTYTPGKINWDGIDTGYVFGEKSSSTSSEEEYKWEEVNFMPASSVYYEDDFGSFTTENPNTDSNVAIVWSATGWTTDGTSDRDRQQSSSNSNYGWEQTYEQDKTYSGGSAHVTDNTGLATATFTFTGNGVDVYSRTHDQVGLITARLYRGVGSMTDEGKYKPAVSIKYIDNISKSGDYYQVPTLFFDDLDYDTYTLVITAGMNGSSGYGTYYLDGVRVYNPLGDLSKLTTKEAEKADKAYKDAGEANSQYIRLRDTLLSDGFSKEDEQLDGTVFIDDLGSEVKVGDASVYEKLGPKNEVYLAAGQAVAFQIENYNSDMKVFAGLKALSGNTTNAKVTATYGDGTTTTREISSSNDLYYKIIPDKGRVVIENTGQNLLAITKIRITNIPNNMGKAKLVSTPQLLSYAEGFNNLPQKEESSTDSSENLDKDDVDIDNPSDSGNKEDNDQIDQGTENGDKEDNNQADQGNSQNNSFWNSLKNSLNKWFGRR